MASVPTASQIDGAIEELSERVLAISEKADTSQRQQLDKAFVDLEAIISDIESDIEAAEEEDEPEEEEEDDEDE
jgi:hypothetical protein